MATFKEADVKKLAAEKTDAVVRAADLAAKNKQLTKKLRDLREQNKTLAAQNSLLWQRV